jgi:hypothetical protein
MTREPPLDADIVFYSFDQVTPVIHKDRVSIVKSILAIGMGLEL